MSGVADLPVVTVVIPVRDMEATIGGQLAALARQDFTDRWEIVVADNGSSDGTIAVVEWWQDYLPLRRVDASRSADSGYARNVAVAAAQSGLLAFCDADDEVGPDWLRVMVSALERNPVVVGRLDHARLNPPKLAATYDQDECDPPWWGFLPAGGAGNLGVRRTVFDEIAGFPEGYRRGVDAAFCWRAQLAGYELTLESAAVVHRRLQALSWWQVFRVHVRDGLGVVRIYQEFRDLGMPRSPLRDLIYDWATVPLWLATGRRYRAARVAGRRVGRLIGSIRSGVLCL